ncbi:MAG: ABC transporter substrate-binding protein [Chloroflexi bacterium]|nr:ABC transporter substrate-binding protein [Chloroflexota bacterium]
MSVMNRRVLLVRTAMAAGGLIGATWLLEACSAAPSASPGSATSAAAPTSAPAAASTTAPPPTTAAATTAPAATQAAPAAAAATAAPRQGGSLVWAMTSDPVTLAPFGVTNTSAYEPGNLAYESLVRWDQNLNVLPALAESWETPDNMTYIFHLRQGVQFHSGKELDSQDVVYSLNSQKSPPPPGNVTTFYPKIASTEALDKYTVKLNMSQPDGTVLGYLAWNIYSHIVPDGLYDRTDPRNTEDGSGPYKITEFVPNDHVTLARHANYWRTGFPYLDGITFKVMTDQQARVAALRSGAVDGTTISSDIIPTLSNDPNLKVLKTVTAAFRELQMTIKGQGKPWEDVRVRQAINAAIDRQAIIDNVYAGDAVFSSKIPASYGDWPIQDAELRSTFEKYDLDAAKKLMNDAGVSGFDVTLQAIANPNDYVQIAEIVKSQLSKININVTVQPLEIGTFGQNNSTGAFEWASTGRGMRGDPSGYMADFDPTGSTYKAWFQGGWTNDEMTQLLNAALGNPDQAARQAQYRRMQEIALTDWPTIPTVDPTIYQVVRSRVQNMYVSIDGTEKGLQETWVTS